MQLFRQHRGFSILMALGITAILMITVTGLAAMYARELKISRLTYDEILAQNSAEWMFEYGMIKIRNHADGFADSVVLSNEATKTDTDAEIFRLKTPRSEWMEMDYKIVANSSDAKFSIGSQETLVIPLGIGDDDIISHESKKPAKNFNNIKITEWLKLDADNSIKWTIVATTDAGENVALVGEWKIDSTTTGDMTLQAVEYICVDDQGVGNVCNKTLYDNISNANRRQELQYSYTIRDMVANFFAMNSGATEFGQNAIAANDDGTPRIELIKPNQKQKNIKYSNFYLVLFNSNITTSQEVVIKSDETSPFSLPKYTITSTAKKWEASQVFEFSEDKSRIYDFLKFGYYDPTEIP